MFAEFPCLKYDLVRIAEELCLNHCAKHFLMCFRPAQCPLAVDSWPDAPLDQLTFLGSPRGRVVSNLQELRIRSFAPSMDKTCFWQ